MCCEIVYRRLHFAECQLLLGRGWSLHLFPACLFYRSCYYVPLLPQLPTAMILLKWQASRFKCPLNCPCTWGLGREWLKGSKEHCCDLPGHLPAGPIEEQQLLLPMENVFGWIPSTLAEHFSAPALGLGEDWEETRAWNESPNLRYPWKQKLQVMPSQWSLVGTLPCLCVICLFVLSLDPQHTVFLIPAPALCETAAKRLVGGRGRECVYTLPCLPRRGALKQWLFTFWEDIYFFKNLMKSPSLRLALPSPSPSFNSPFLRYTGWICLHNASLRNPSPQQEEEIQQAHHGTHWRYVCTYQCGTSYEEHVWPKSPRDIIRLYMP